MLELNGVTTIEKKARSYLAYLTYMYISKQNYVTNLAYLYGKLHKTYPQSGTDLKTVNEHVCMAVYNLNMAVYAHMHMSSFHEGHPARLAVRLLWEPPT